MLLHAFPSLFVSSLREFPENCVYKHAQTVIIEYLHRKFSHLNDIESAKKCIYWVCILKQ